MDFSVFGLALAFLITPIILSILAVAALAWCTIQKIRNSGSFAEQRSYKYFLSALIFLGVNIVGLVLLYAALRTVPISMGRNFPSLLIFVWLPINLLAVYRLPAVLQKY